MIWVGLERYGYLEEAQRLAYRFLYMMTTAFVDFNGVVPEKVHSLIDRILQFGLTFISVRRSQTLPSRGRRVW